MRERITRSLPAIVWMTFIFVMSAQERFPGTFGVSVYMVTIVAHMVLYGILALLLLLAISGSQRPTRTAMLAAVVGAVLYGISDEFHQSFVPGRDASVFDLVVNAIGATLAVIGLTQLRTIVMADSSR